MRKPAKIRRATPTPPATLAPTTLALVTGSSGDDTANNPLDPR